MNSKIAQNNEKINSKEGNIFMGTKISGTDRKLSEEK